MRQLGGTRIGATNHPLMAMVGGIWGICALVMLLCVLARLPFLIAPGLSIDSYTNLDGWPPMSRFVSQGRFGQYFLFQGLESLGVDPATFATLFQTIGFAAFAFTSPLFFAAFGRTLAAHRLALVLSSLLLVLHPFQAEILTFSEASFTALLAISIGLCAVFIVARSPRLWWLGAVLLVFALSLYQLVLNYVCLMVLLGMLLIYLRSEGPLRSHWGSYRPAIAGAAMVLVGLIAYLVINKVLITVLDVPMDGRGQTLAFDQIGTRWQDVKGFGSWLVGHPLFLVPSKAAGLIFWSFVLAGWGLLLVRVLRRWRAETPVAALVVLAMPAVGLGVVLLGASWWPAPRVLGGVVAVFAIGCFCLCVSSRARWAKAVVGSLAGMVLISSVAIGHRIHSDQMLLNAHDGFLAEQLYAALRTHGDFTEKTPVAVVNNTLKWTHPASLATTWMDMNISAFSIPSAVRARVALSTGRVLNIRQATEEETARCASTPNWPDQGFVSNSTDGSLLACL